jgi:hypothetical protein
MAPVSSSAGGAAQERVAAIAKKTNKVREIARRREVRARENVMDRSSGKDGLGPLGDVKCNLPVPICLPQFYPEIRIWSR